MGKIKMPPDRTLKTVQFALLVALTVVLQLLCSVMTIGPVTITLSLVPVVIGAALFGASGGAFLGFVLGLVNFIASFSNPVLLFLFESSPVLYILTCFGKTIAAGAVAGLLHRILRERHPYVGVTLAALSAPVVNTGIFFVMMALFFREAIRESCGLGTGNVVAFIVTGFIGVNFLIEFALNAVLCPAIARIIAVVRAHYSASRAVVLPETGDERPVVVTDGEPDRGPYGTASAGELSSASDAAAPTADTPADGPAGTSADDSGELSADAPDGRSADVSASDEKGEHPLA